MVYNVINNVEGSPGSPESFRDTSQLPQINTGSLAPQVVHDVIPSIREGVQIHVDRYPPSEGVKVGKRLIITRHGITSHTGNDPVHFLAEAIALTRERGGDVVVSFDAVGHGKSVKQGHHAIHPIAEEVRDFLDVIDYYKKPENGGFNEFVAIGHSRGGYVAALAQRECQELRHVITIAAPPSHIDEKSGRLGIPNSIIDYRDEKRISEKQITRGKLKQEIRDRLERGEVHQWDKMLRNGTVEHWTCTRESLIGPNYLKGVELRHGQVLDVIASPNDEVMNFYLIAKLIKNTPNIRFHPDIMVGDHNINDGYSREKVKTELRRMLWCQ